jgi:hypothetical protein
MTIFLLLNGLGVAFLLYVLANFLREGRQTRNDTLPPYRLFAKYGSSRQIFVATRTVASTAKKMDETSVLPFPDGKVHTEAGGTEPDERENLAPLSKYATR